MFRISQSSVIQDALRSVASFNRSIIPPMKSFSTQPIVKTFHQPISPRLSASLILVKPLENNLKTSDGFDYRVLLLHRNSYSGDSFLSARVFPGGNLEKHDLENYDDFFSGKNLSLESIDQNIGVQEALKICSIRETFEETGILIGLDSIGHHSNLKASETLRLHHKRLIHGESDFKSVLRALAETGDERFMGDNNGGKFSLDSLEFYSNWITPNVFKKRYDTFFYTYLVPPYNKDMFEELSSLNLNSSESTSLDWLTPSESISRSLESIGLRKNSNKSASDFLLPPPQFYILSQLSVFKNFRSIFFPNRDNNFNKQADLLEGRCLKFDAELIKIEKSGLMTQTEQIFSLSSLNDFIDQDYDEDQIKFYLVLPGDPFHSTSKDLISQNKTTLKEETKRSSHLRIIEDDQTDSDDYNCEGGVRIHRFEVILPSKLKKINFFGIKGLQRIGMGQILGKDWVDLNF
ncbi:hypothetical protein BY996DRAFT_6850774 [Phakopsora pachyrhizi]|nr:hypothetical protein BY996DRAFT_6850774 [Phakopsora pachyrhizi]